MLLCQFLVLAGNRFWLYILLCAWSTIQLWCCVMFFWFWREIVFGVTYVLSLQYSCAVLSFFCCGGKVLLQPEKKNVLVVCLDGCAVVSVFGSGGK